MTDMRRVTVSLPEELDKRIADLRNCEPFARCSYSEVVRRLLDCGFKVVKAEHCAGKTH